MAETIIIEEKNIFFCPDCQSKLSEYPEGDKEGADYNTILVCDSCKNTWDFDPSL